MTFDREIREGPDGEQILSFGLLEQLRYESEEAGCVHMLLDDMKVPREEDGRPYSLVGRVKWALENRPISPAVVGASL